jgi:hypothetical protein
MAIKPQIRNPGNLGQLGCEVGQGYAIAHPMLAAELPDWIASWRPASRWCGMQPVA